MTDPSECTHTTTRVSDGYYVDVEDWDGNSEQEWEPGEEYEMSTTVDIDLHRYRCTQCGEVGYYSGRAREHFEQGMSFPEIGGLE